MSKFTVDAKSVKFWLQVKPRARHERLVRNSAGDLQLELLAPPVEGKANQAVIAFLAKALRVPRSSVEIVTGEKSRRKLVRISVAPGGEAVAKLNALAQEGSK